MITNFVAWASVLFVCCSKLAFGQTATQPPFQSSLELGWPIAQSGDKVNFGPNPDDPYDILLVLIDAQIRKELQLKDDQLTALMRMRDEVNAGGEVALMRPFIAARIDEILTPTQLRRARELAFRVEVGIIGLGLTLCDGRVGNEVGVYENQKTLIRRKSEKLDQEYETAVLRLKQDTEAQILALLRPDQQVRFRELVGTYPNFVEQSAQKKLYLKVVEQNRASREMAKP